MSPHAGQHALVIFVAVFGGATIWFSLYIVLIRRNMVRYYRDPRGLIPTIPTILFVALILWFWR
jgi:hypothetical protein